MTHPTKLGDRARFVGKDSVFHSGEREGKIGTVVLDADLDYGSNFGGGTCGWQVDGQEGVYVTAIEDLELL
jgi:hypothetical protein